MELSVLVLTPMSVALSVMKRFLPLKSDWSEPVAQLPVAVRQGIRLPSSKDTLPILP